MNTVHELCKITRHQWKVACLTYGTTLFLLLFSFILCLFSYFLTLPYVPIIFWNFLWHRNPTKGFFLYGWRLAGGVAGGSTVNVLLFVWRGEGGDSVTPLFIQNPARLNIFLTAVLSETVLGFLDGNKVLSLYALMVFKVFQKLFTTLYNYKLFVCLFKITY